RLSAARRQYARDVRFADERDPQHAPRRLPAEHRGQSPPAWHAAFRAQPDRRRGGRSADVRPRCVGQLRGRRHPGADQPAQLASLFVKASGGAARRREPVGGVTPARAGAKLERVPIENVRRRPLRPAGTGEAQVDKDKTARVSRDGRRGMTGGDLESAKTSLDRRRFLTGAATGAAALAVAGAEAQTTAADAVSPAVPAPTPRQVERDTGDVRPPEPPPRAAIRPGSDLMVQVLKDLGIEF